MTIEPATARPRNPRYGSLDLWRGIACLLVVIYHSTILHTPNDVSRDDSGTANASMFATMSEWAVAATHHLWIGVPLFFVISGYCIAATADSSRRKAQGAKSYFVRRFRRIYPPYWAIVAGTAVFVALVDVVAAPRLLSSQPWPQFRPWWFSPSQWFGNLTLTESWRHYLFGSPRGHFVGQSWTLCYEEQFYAVMGALMLLARRRVFLGVIVVSALTVLAEACAHWMDVPIKGFFFDGLWLQFAAGAAVYFWINYATVRQRWLLAGVLCLGVLASLTPWSPAGDGGAAALAFALALLALHRWDAAICSFRPLQPLFYCGTICYSMYLAHPPLVRAATKILYASNARDASFALFVVIPISLAISVIAGSCCYAAIERWFLNPPQPRDAASKDAAGDVSSGGRNEQFVSVELAAK